MNNNFKPRLSSLNALLSHQVATNRVSRAVNQIENVKEKKTAELADLNTRPVMQKNSMGYTTFNSLLTIIYGEEGKRVFQVKQQIEQDLIKKKLSFQPGDVYKLLLTKAFGSDENFIKLFGIKGPGLLFDKCEKKNKLYWQMIYMGLEFWMDLLWDQTRDTRILADGSCDASDELPAVVRKRKTEAEAEQAKAQDEAERGIAKRRKKNAAAATSATSATTAATSSATAASDGTNNSSMSELERMKANANAARAGAASSAPTAQHVDVGGFLSFAMDRSSKKDAAKAAQLAKKEAERFQQNASPWEKAMAILQKKEYIKDGYSDVLAQVMQDAGCLEAEDLQFSSKPVRHAIADCLREIPKNRFAVLVQITLKTSGAVAAHGGRAHSGVVSPPPVGHAFARDDEVESSSSKDSSDSSSDPEGSV